MLWDTDCFTGNYSKSNFIAVVECQPSWFPLMGDYEQGMSSETSSTLICVFDIIMVFVIWASLIAIEPVLKVTEQEVEDYAITASDFTVQLCCSSKTKTPLAALPAAYYAWATEILRQENPKKLGSGFYLDDPHINEVANVTLGLSDYSYLVNMQKIGRLMKKRELAVSNLAAAQVEKKKEKFQQQIDKLTNKCYE